MKMIKLTTFAPLILALTGMAHARPAGASHKALLSWLFAPVAPPLVRVTLSPETPQQGDAPSAFISVQTGYDSPEKVRVFVKATLDGHAIADLLHPAEELWIARLGTLRTITEHELRVETLIEDQEKAKAIHDRIIALNHEILTLQSRLDAELDPAQKARLQAEFALKISQRADLESAVLALRKPVGSDTVRFSVSPADPALPGYPHITGISPNFAGPGDRITSPRTVTISGSGFSPQSQVFFGGVVAPSVQFTSPGLLQAEVPSLSPGIQDLEVRNPDGLLFRNSFLKNGFFVLTHEPGGGGTLPNLHPVAFAGYPQDAAPSGLPVTLDGSLSYDDNGDPLIYRWRFISKPSGSGLTDPAITPDPAAAAIAHFTPDIGGSYTLALVVSDGVLSSVPSLITISAFQPVGISLSPSSATLETRVGQAVSQMVSLTNTSNAETLVLLAPIKSGDPGGRISLVVEGGACGTDPAACPPGGGGGATFPLSLTPGQSLSMTLSYQPVAAGESISTSYLFVGHDSINVTATLAVSAVSHEAFPLVIEQRIPNSGQVLALYPATNGAPVAIIPNFADAGISQDIVVRNTGTTAVTIARAPELIAMQAPMGVNVSVDPGQFPVIVPAQGEVNVRFTATPPANPVPMPGSETVDFGCVWDLGLLPGDLPVSFRIGSVLAAQNSLHGGGLSFSPVEPGQSAQLTLALFQPMPMDWGFFRIRAAAVTGPDASAFAFSMPQGNPLPTWVGSPSQQFPVPIQLPDAEGRSQITFSPLEARAYSAELEVSFDGFAAPMRYTLQGTGGSAPPPGACPPSQTACPAATGGTFCTNLGTDPANCGICGNVCPAALSCVAGACTAPQSSNGIQATVQ